IVAILFVAQLPAEVIHPIVRVGPLEVTNLEITGYLLIATHAASIAAGEPIRRLSRVGTIGLVVFLVAAVASTAFALYDPVTSAKTILRLSAAFLVGHALAHEVLSSTTAWARVAVAFLAGASVSAALGISDFVTGGTLVDYEALFREAHLTVGGFAVRATGTLLHPNVAGWLWGIAGVSAMVAAITARSMGARILAVSAAGLFLVALVLALSRGALIATVVATVAACVILVRTGLTWRRSLLLLLPLAVFVTVGAFASPVIAARLLSETEQEWYRFAVDAPAAVVLEKATTVVPVRVTNVTPVQWHDQGVGEVQVSYHLKDSEGNYVEYEGARTSLPGPLGPGETAEVPVRIRAIPGYDTLLIEWDLIQEGRTWFSERFRSDVPPTHAVVSVTPGESAEGSDRPRGPTRTEQDLSESRSFGRSTLWRVAVDMIMARPVTGIGLDNFRLGYGEWLGLSNWDQDINSNSLYLELLVSVGIGAVGIVVAAAAAVVGLARRVSVPLSPSTFALIVLSATAAHGVFDSFLTYSTPIYLVSWATVLGLVRAPPTR
ncbi:MAG: O-antigen ligase family protein, partial [Chloroflexi bacterium]|nr:O-antigen ligase family protein [Chloroflexota bacterium]